MTIRASGTFEVKLTPSSAENKPQESAQGSSKDSPIGRMLIDKQFQGDLEGTSKGEMLAAMTGVKGSAGYVALEQVTGTLQGRKGTFVLQHSGTMARGEQQLTVTVIPDSATAELTGLTGKMMILIEGGKHFYDFDYTLPEATEEN